MITGSQVLALCQEKLNVKHNHQCPVTSHAAAHCMCMLTVDSLHCLSSCRAVRAYSKHTDRWA